MVNQYLFSGEPLLANKTLERSELEVRQSIVALAVELRGENFIAAICSADELTDFIHFLTKSSLNFTSISVLSDQGS